MGKLGRVVRCGMPEEARRCRGLLTNFGKKRCEKPRVEKCGYDKSNSVYIYIQKIIDYSDHSSAQSPRTTKGTVVIETAKNLD